MDAIGRNRRRIHPNLVAFIAERADELHAKDIRRLIAAEPGLRGLETPSLRTIQSLVTEVRGRTPIGRDIDALWDFLAADAETVALVLAVLRDVTARRQTLTQRHAERIAWLRTGWPDIPSAEVFGVARVVATNLPGVDWRLLPYLTFTPWRDKGKAYVAAFAAHRFTGLFLTDSSRPAFERWTNEKTGGQPEGQPPAEGS